MEYANFKNPQGLRNNSIDWESVTDSDDYEFTSCLNSWVFPNIYFMKFIKLHFFHPPVSDSMHCSHNLRNLPFPTHSFSLETDDCSYCQFDVFLRNFLLVCLHLRGKIIFNFQCLD